MAGNQELDATLSFDALQKSCGPEKLVLCIDSACIMPDMKRRLRCFLDLKCMVNRHEIALAVMTDNDVNWLCSFQPYDIKFIMDKLSLNMYDRNDRLSGYYGKRHSQMCDLTKLFKNIFLNVECNDKTSLRVILLYMRTECKIGLESFCYFDQLQANVLFAVDVVYISQEPSKARNQTEKLYHNKMVLEVVNSLQKICNSYSYMFIVHNPEELAESFLQLLAHPSLRKAQHI